MSGKRNLMLCDKHIMCGACPYEGRCKYIHDPKLNTLQNTMLRPLKNEKDMHCKDCGSKDSFFWPNVQRNGVTPYDEYEVSPACEPKFYLRHRAVYSMWKHFKQYCAESNSNMHQNTKDINIDSLYDPTVLVNMQTCSKRLSVFINLSNGQSLTSSSPGHSTSSSPATVLENGIVMSSSPSSVTSYMHSEYEHVPERTHANIPSVQNVQAQPLVQLQYTIPVKARPNMKIVSNNISAYYAPIVSTTATNATADIHHIYNTNATGTTAPMYSSQHPTTATATTSVPLIYSPNFTRKMLSLQMT